MCTHDVLVHVCMYMYVCEAQHQVMVVGKLIYLDVTKFIYVRYLIIFILFFYSLFTTKINRFIYATSALHVPLRKQIFGDFNDMQAAFECCLLSIIPWGREDFVCWQVGGEHTWHTCWYGHVAIPAADSC